MGGAEPYTPMSVRGVEDPPEFQVEPGSQRNIRDRLRAASQQPGYPISISGEVYAGENGGGPRHFASSPDHWAEKKLGIQPYKITCIISQDGGNGGWGSKLFSPTEGEAGKRKIGSQCRLEIGMAKCRESIGRQFFVTIRDV